jgi:hypothetical protein
VIDASKDPMPDRISVLKTPGLFRDHEKVAANHVNSRQTSSHINKNQISGNTMPSGAALAAARPEGSLRLI